MGEIQNQSISFKKIFEEALSLYKKYYRVVIFMGILTVLCNILDQEVFAKSFYKDSFALWSAFFIVLFVITMAFYSAATWYIHNHLSGFHISLADSFSQSLRRVVPVSVSGILLVVMSFVGLVAFIIPGIFVLVIFSQAYYFVLLKGVGVREAFSESRKVTKGNRLKIAAIIGLSFLPHILLLTIFGESFPVLAQSLLVIPESFLIVLTYVLWRSLASVSLASK